MPKESNDKLIIGKVYSCNQKTRFSIASFRAPVNFRYRPDTQSLFTVCGTYGLIANSTYMHNALKLFNTCLLDTTAVLFMHQWPHAPIANTTSWKESPNKVFTYLALGCSHSLSLKVCLLRDQRYSAKLETYFSLKTLLSFIWQSISNPTYPHQVYFFEGVRLVHWCVRLLHKETST